MSGKAFRSPAPTWLSGGWTWSLLVIGVVLLGAGLRFYGLGAESLWIDEGVSVNRAGFDATRIIRQAQADPTPPLYYLLLHYWVAVFGDSDYVVRVPSALAGSLSVFVMYRLGTLISSRTVGLVAALILAVVPWHVRFSQEARAYEVFCLLVLLSFYFFVRLLRESGPAPVPLVGYIVATAGAAYAHVYGLFVLAAQDLYLLAALLLPGGLDREAGLRRWILVHAALAVLYVPGIIFLHEQMSNPQGRMWVDEPGLRLLERLPALYAGSFWMACLLGGLAAGAVLGNLASLRGNLLLPPGKIYLLVAWFLASTALPFVISKYYSVTVLGHERHTIAASLAFYLLAAEGIRMLGDMTRRRPVLVATACLLVALSAPALYGLYTTVDKNQWREATHYVDEHAGRSDLMLYNNGLLFRHYSKREDLERYVIYETPDDVLVGHERVWVMLSGSAKIPPQTEANLDRSFRLAYRKHYRGIELILFENRSLY
jgi:mannosyltransferase